MPDQTDILKRIEPGAADQSKYLIHSRLGIASILGTLHKAGSLVTAYFGSGNDFILTSIVAVKPEQNEVVMDYGADAAANQRALQARKITFVAAHERIKIQFVTASLRQVRFDGRDAFGMPLPAELLRLQRREYFRIATPLTRPLKCVIAPQGAPVRAPVRAPAEVTIVDISCGGIAIIDSSEPADLEAGMCFRNCRILLPDIGTVTADMLIKSTFEVTLKNGARHKHAGCEFVDMPERNRALIQRYINKMERERKTRAGGR
jgi:c-di-GMP-binding flagellar brake protein YcgR